MSKSEQDRILNRVRKMINLANNAGATEGERDNALRMAHATLAKYNLELVQDDGAPTSQQAGEPREQQEETFLGYPWARQVANAVAALFFCEYYFAGIPGTARVQHNFIGRYSNATTAREMSRYLVESIHREARAYQRASGVALQSQYTSFAGGAMRKIRERCEALRVEAERPAPTGGNGMSLVVVYNDEAAANTKFLQSTGVKLRSANSATITRDGYAALAGAAYGARVSLDRQLGGKS